ncbi:MAG: flavodoxin family protein [Nanoarchaeota archaeon]|nr:flavodoxin family protein [Nanoarchaeota archaeon]
MKCLVIYDSVTGNTKKIADAIGNTINCKVVKIDLFTSDKTYDLIFVGTPVHGAYPTKKVRKALERINCNCALFCTYGAPFFGYLTAKKCLRKMESLAKGKVLETFACKGMHHLLHLSKGHPNKEDLTKARKFAKKAAKKTF